MEVITMITQYLPWVLLGILGVFVVFGMLFGLGRGFKRSLIRLGIVLVFIGGAFLLTPVTARFIYSWDISIAGHTPAGWVEVLITNLQDADNMEYLVPLVPYLQNYAVVALALVNIVLFIGLYFVAKWISWIVYAIVAHCCAPKKNKEGQKVKKHAWLGMLVGLVQGVVLFFFFMIPFNGLIGLTGQVANHEALGGIQVAAGTTSNTAVTTAASDRDDDSLDIVATAQTIDDSLTIYKNVLRYTGLEFLSNQAFAYEMTVKVADGNQVNLAKDIVTSLQLYADWNAFAPALDRVEAVTRATGDQALGLAALQHNDYEAMRYLLNKVFSLDLLRMGDTVLADVDKILTTSVSGNGVVLAGAESWSGNKIYDDSFYGVLIKEYADPTHREEFITGVRAMVNYLAKTKLDLVKRDLLKGVDIMEDLFTLEVTMPNTTTALPLAVALSREDLAPTDYIDILLTPVSANDYYPANYTAFEVMFKRTLELQVFQVLTQPKAAQVITYGNFFDGLDTNATGLENFLRTFVAGFFGEKAIGTDDDPGAWLKLRNLAKTVLGVAKDYVTVADDFYAIVDELCDANPDKSADELYPQAIMQYLSSLLNDDEDTKYDRIDTLAGALHDVCFTFPEVAAFLKLQVVDLTIPEGMQAFGDFKQVLVDLLSSDTSTVADWQGLLRGVVDLTDLLTNNEVISKIMSVDFSDPDATKEILTLIVGTGDDGEDALLQPADVAQVIYTVINMPNLGETVSNVIAQFGDSLGEEFDTTEISAKLSELQDKDVEELTDILSSVWDDLRALLQEGN